MRTATLLAALAIAVATPAPASACIIAGGAVTQYFEAPPSDLQPGETVLEVRFLDTDEFIQPSTGSGERVVVTSGMTLLNRYRVVRVVSGQFDGETVLIPFFSSCGSYRALPASGDDRGLVVGFARPPSPHWDGPPAMFARGPNQSLPYRNWDPEIVAAAEGGDPDAMVKLVRDAADPAVKKLWFDRAAPILRARAQAGDASAMLEFGLALRFRDSFDFGVWRFGPTVTNDGSTADWVKRAAELGEPRAMYLMAENYVSSPDRATIRALKLDWYLKAAEAGHACSMGRMAQTYRFGWGVPVDRDKSLAWYHKAIAAGAIMSPYGYEIEGDPPKGLRTPPPLQCPPVS